MMLYYITDRMPLGPSEPLRRARLLELVRRAAEAGIDHIQLREKDLPPRELLTLAHEVRQVIAGRSRLLLNSRVDVAIAAGVDGVHLPANDLQASDARVAFHRAGNSDPVIGVSCHSMEEVALAEAHGADLSVFGPVFDKGGSGGVGLAALAAVCTRPAAAAGRMPVLALGGVSEANAAACAQAGAGGVAGIRLFQAAEDLGALCSRLRSIKANHDPGPPHSAYSSR